MKAIIYTSNTGYTEQYAKMLGGKLGLPVYALKDAPETLNGTEIIYLGWLMAGNIRGYKKAAKTYKVSAVCGVGMGKDGSQLDEARKQNSVPESVALFTLQGGFDFTKLRGIYKFMMNTMKRTVGKKFASKPDKTSDEADMLDLLQNGGSRVNEGSLTPLLEWYGKSRK